MEKQLVLSMNRRVYEVAMSKTAQRKITLKHEANMRFINGQKTAQQQKAGMRVCSGYFGCMAWRAGFYRTGGKKFW